ncbi:MAG: PD-(D/E)XK nuclease family protein [Clostridia bacterium]|nr:PD-(D/E)XK nuclease family protein [Clostridia bacterium]
MIRFLFGKPGTGKTHEVYEGIRREITGGKRRVFLIVPEQQVYSAEASFLSSLPPEAGQRFSVVSFSRLCDLVADKYGGRTACTLTKAAKSLLMWRNLRELRGLMEAFTAPDGDDTSLCRLMLDEANELAVNAIDPVVLEKAAERLDHDSPLYHKLRDISLAAASYDRLVREVCGDAPSDRMIRTAEKIRRHGFFRDASVWIDSFTSYTAEEYALLRPIFEQADSVTVTISAGSRDVDRLLFRSVRDTVVRLTRLCEDAGVSFEDVVLTDCRRTDSETLRYLEAHLWDFSLTPDRRKTPADLADGPIRLISAPNMYEEARAAALHIGELRARGIPYGEIAVVVRDTAEWRHVLDAALETAHVPFFLSERTGLSDKPAARLLLSALRCIRRGYLTGDVISLAKTGLCGVGLKDLDAFCDYLETWRISGRRMKEGPWSMNPDGYQTDRSSRGTAILTAANRVRDRIIPPLLRLEDALKSAESTEEQCRALYAYLTELSVSRQMSDNAKTLLSGGHAKEAGELVRLWSFIVQALADLSTCIPAEEGALTLDDLSAALSLLFDETDIGSVPGRHDCVTVGSASTVRLENVQAVLLLGLCEGEFPRSVTDQGLLSEQDKASLETLGIEFDARADKLTSEELLYVYRAVTKASGRVLLFTHEGTPDNTQKSPSIAYTRVRWLFPDLVPLKFREADLDVDVGDAPRYDPPADDVLKKSFVRSFMEEPLKLSHSSLQKYARCPYSYFGGHILKIREKAEARINNLSSGKFLHYVMENYLRESLAGGQTVRSLTDDELRTVTDRIMTDYIRFLGEDAETDGRVLHLFARLRTLALVLVTSVQRELEQGSFSVAGLEMDVGGHRASAPQPLRIKVELDGGDGQDDFSAPLPTFASALSGRADDGLFSLPLLRKKSIIVSMDGRADRVDYYRDGKTVYIRVVDYKSSERAFSEKKVFSEPDFQLLLYLFTLCAPANRRLFADENGMEPDSVLPAEVMYISPSVDTITGVISPSRSGLIVDLPEVLGAASAGPELAFLPDVVRKRNGQIECKALCSLDHMKELEPLICELISDITRSIFSGHAERTPGPDACRFCTLNETCPIACRSKPY